MKSWSDIENFIWENQRGILITLAFHFILAISFMGLKLKTIKNEEEVGIMIEFPQEEQENIIEKELPIDEEENYNNREAFHNISTNISAKAEKIFDIDKYIDEVQGQLDSDNPKEKLDQKLEDLNAQLEQTLAELKKEKKKKNVVFAGKTAIVCDLKNRMNDYMSSPVYKCEGAGKVVVKIIVNQSGRVIKAEVILEQSQVSSECFYEMATEAALKSKFNADLTARNKQVGTITYYFIQQ